MNSLYGGRKLFHFKENLNAKREVIAWECFTYVNSRLVIAKAPTKVEAYRVAVITILKEFYYFPFDDHMELPTGQIGKTPFTGNPFQKQFLYPVYEKFDAVQRFIVKEKAYGKILSLVTFHLCFNINKKNF